MARVPAAAKRAARALAERYFDADGKLVGEPAGRVSALVDEVGRLRADQQAWIRIAPDVMQHAELAADRAAHARQTTSAARRPAPPPPRS